MQYWEGEKMHSIKTFQITQIVYFFCQLWVAVGVLLALCRHPLFIRKGNRFGTASHAYFIAAITTIGTFAITGHFIKPFGPISMKSSVTVMVTEFVVPPLLLLLAGMIAVNSVSEPKLKVIV